MAEYVKLPEVRSIFRRIRLP